MPAESVGETLDCPREQASPVSRKCSLGRLRKRLLKFLWYGGNSLTRQLVRRACQGSSSHTGWAAPAPGESP
jgi:hypothetical protein